MHRLLGRLVAGRLHGRKVGRSPLRREHALIVVVDRMRSDRSLTERILGVLRPYASNWSGTLGRGDLVIPQRDIPRVVHEILDAMHDESGWEEASEREVVEALLAIRRSASVQDQADRLRRQFVFLRRSS
jgi:hypothetical protein